MNFMKAVLNHAEVKRGASHLLVGLAIGLVSIALFGDTGE